MLNSYPDVLTVTDLCKILRIGRNRAYDLLRSGAINSFQFGRSWRIPKPAVEEYLHQKSQT